MQSESLKNYHQEIERTKAQKGLTRKNKKTKQKTSLIPYKFIWYELNMMSSCMNENIIFWASKEERTFETIDWLRACFCRIWEYFIFCFFFFIRKDLTCTLHMWRSIEKHICIDWLFDIFLRSFIFHLLLLFPRYPLLHFASFQFSTQELNALLTFHKATRMSKQQKPLNFLECISRISYSNLIVLRT